MKRMANLVWCVMLMFISFTLSSCSGGRMKEVKRLNATDFAALLEENEMQILDVRTQPEFLSGHIPEAININIKSQNFDHFVEERLSRDTPVAVYCLQGNRSQIAADILVGMGFEVYELEGGIATWDGSVSR